MKESLIRGYEELKRAEHLLFVSLKYTRTADVMKSVIERLVATYQYAIEGILTQLEEEARIFEIPTTPLQQVTVLRKELKDDAKLMDFLDLYLFFRKVMRSQSSVVREFRKHVTMTIVLEDQSIELTVDILHEYYDHTRDFFKYVTDYYLRKE